MSKILFAFALVFSNSALAAGKPIILREKGKPVTATWPSGNEAQLNIFLGEALDTTVEFKVSENSCSSTVGQTLKFHMPASANLLLWMWTKHSDPQKVGKLVMRGNLTLADALFFSNGMHFRFPDLANIFVKDRMEPVDLSFIGLDGPFHAFDIDFWFSETMFRNPESGVMENRISFNGEGAHVGEDGSLLSFDSGSEMGSGGSPLALIGDVVTWIVHSDKGSCQVSFKPDKGPAFQVLTQYLGRVRGPFNPYIWMSDDISTIIQEASGSPVRDENVEAADE